MASQATNALVKNRERVLIMEEHLKNVRQEVGHTNALMAAKKKEIATEEHLCALAAREAGRYDLHQPLCRLFMHSIGRCDSAVLRSILVPAYWREFALFPLLIQ